MSNFKYTAGLNNVGSYQVSGVPFVTSSTIPTSSSSAIHWKVEFPLVTKEITIANHAQNSHNLARVAFSQEGLKDSVGNYFLIGSSKDGVGPTTLNVKATELYIMSDDNHTDTVSIFASLTYLPVERVNNISPSGSNWSGSAGIG
jgi:hypothetical protein